MTRVSPLHLAFDLLIRPSHALNLLTWAADTREEDLTHPEDIAHFAKHDADAEAAERQEQLDRMPIVEHNIPQKFRRVQ